MDLHVLAKELAELKIRVSLLQAELVLFRGVDPEDLERRFTDALLSEDGRLVFEATLVRLKTGRLPE